MRTLTLITGCSKATEDAERGGTRPDAVFTGSLRAHGRNRLGGRGREQGELSRQEVMEAGSGGAVASMHIPDLLRGWNQQNLLMDKVWGERAGEGL